jgi:hypothetical protein
MVNPKFEYILAHTNGTIRDEHLSKNAPVLLALFKNAQEVTDPLLQNIYNANHNAKISARQSLLMQTNGANLNSYTVQDLNKHSLDKTLKNQQRRYGNDENTPSSTPSFRP